MPKRRSHRWILSLGAAFALLSASSCAIRRAPGAPRVGLREQGVASWYGEPFHGRRTANGEVYDMNRISAAHRTLPFGAIVRVTNLDNGRRLDLRINDRGPFVKNRILDVSRAAAMELGMIGPGTARVEVRVLHLP